jgi:hypothetical protein
LSWDYTLGKLNLNPVGYFLCALRLTHSYFHSPKPAANMIILYDVFHAEKRKAEKSGEKSCTRK